MANKINEIIEVINDGGIDEELIARVDNLEEEINKPWILCPTDIDLFDFNNDKVNYDLKIVYSLTCEYQHTDVDNVMNKLVTGTIFLNKNDPLDATQSLIFKTEGDFSVDIYNILFLDTGITYSSIDYGISHSPMPFHFRGTAFNPLNGNCRVRTKDVNINFQTSDMTVSYNNPFINIYYKGE